MRRLVLVAALVGASLAAAREPAALPFIEDDYPRALRLAQQKKLPIFVDSWAPW